MSGEWFWSWLAVLLFGAAYYLYWDWFIRREKEEDPYSDDEGSASVAYANRWFGAATFIFTVLLLFLRLLGLY